jgi:hypothetical protein
LHYGWWKQCSGPWGTVGLFGWHHQQQPSPDRPTPLHICISKACLAFRVFNTSLQPLSTPFIRAHFTASSQHSQSSSCTPHPPDVSTDVIRLGSPFLLPKHEFRFELWVN